MAVGIIIVGDEILSGRRQDKHLSASIERLAARGMQLAWASYCGDDPRRLTAVLRDTFAGEDIVFSFGGIGATPDDHTRQCAAAALNVPLRLHPEAEQLIRARIRERYNEEASAARLQMGEFPEGSRTIPNPVNQIPGFSLHHHHFVPGFPEMAWPMIEWVLDTYYRDMQHLRSYAERSLRVFDTYESKLVDLMTRLQDEFGVTVFSLPNLGSDGERPHIELGAKGDPVAVQRAMESMRLELTERRLETGEVPASAKS